MKGIVFSFKNKEDGARSKKAAPDFKYLLKRYGLQAVFAVLLLIGLGWGAVCARKAGESTLDSLDFLFTTNLSARLEHGFLGILCACFASDFIFLSAVFLLGFVPWGSPAIAAVAVFKGFGTGITAGYLCLSHALPGAGFYVLILLPGTFLFCVTLVLFSKSAALYSFKMLAVTLKKERYSVSMRRETLALCSRCVSSLTATALAALLDASLWTLFAGNFNF